MLRSCSAYDPRQYVPKVHPSTQRLEGGVRNLKSALVREGFGHPQSEPEGDEKVRKAAELLGKLGATITAVSIPWHLLGGAIFFPGVEGWSTPVHQR